MLQMGDDIALVGYPDAHARLDPSFRNGKEVFDRDLLDMRIVTEEIVVKKTTTPSAAAWRNSSLPTTAAS